MAEVSAAHRHMARSGRPWRARRSESTQKRGDAEWLWNIFNICQCYTHVSSQLISFTMPLPDSSDVARVRIEPHITAEGDGGHQGVACKKMCMYSWQVCPIRGFCAGLSPELHWLHQAVKAFLCLFMEVYRPLFVFLHFFPSVPWKKAAWVSHAGDFSSSGDSPSCVRQLRHTKGIAGQGTASQQVFWPASGHMAKFPDGPIVTQINKTLGKSCHHTLGLHIFSVSSNLYRQGVWDMRSITGKSLLQECKELTVHTPAVMSIQSKSSKHTNTF